MRMKVLWTCVIGAMVAASAIAAPVSLVKINFQLAGAPIPPGYLPDTGLAYGDRGNGWSYGWNRDISADTRDRNNANAPDQRYDTLIHLQKAANAIWEITVPNGLYDLFIACGDPESVGDQTNSLNVEGTQVPDPTPMSGMYDNYTLTTITVTDGRLTIQPGTGSANVKLCFIDIANSDPKFNPAPVVNAGPDQFFAKPTFPLVATMAATATDQDPIDPTEPRGTLTMTWSQVSGPAATFSNTAIEDPTITFTAAGDYVFKLVASDGSKQTEDTIAVYVNDTTKDMLMAHWNFESLTTANKSVVDVAKGNNGLWTAAEPNQLPTIVPGWITGSTQAVDFRAPAANPPIVKVPGPAQVTVTIADTEPNFVYGPRYAITISAWIKVSTFARTWSTVASHGDNSWRLTRNNNGNTMVCHITGPTAAAGSPGYGPDGTISVNDNFWHHVCSTYDGEKMRLYIDGVLDVEGTYSGLINTSTYAVQLGGNSQAANRQWDGILDDVRVYNYAISETDIRALTAQGKTIPFVDAGTIVSPLTYKTGAAVPLNGRVLDYGTPGTVTAMWTTVSSPTVDEAIFTDPGSPTTTVKFPAFGQYKLRLTAVDMGIDPQNPVTVFDEITVDVVRPTCADVKEAGLMLVGDFDENCRVNLADFAILAADWLRCNDPANYNPCFWPFLQ